MNNKIEMKNWRQIWESRDTSIVRLKDEDVLTKLIQIDGFDGGGGKSSITEDIWRAYVSFIKTELSIQSAEAIFEVGCGCGAILYPFYQAGHKVGGIDLSETLIQKAKEFFPGMDLTSGEASSMEVESQYDFVIANSMFFYFPNYEYASLVLDKMYEKAKKGIAILDVPDILLKDKLEEKKRRETPDYDEKYSGLKHLYYSKSFFLDFAESKQSSKISFIEQNIKDYGYNGYRFNCFITK
jgi:SAM-dependent methyltransferase